MRHRKRVSTEVVSVLHAPSLEEAKSRLDSVRLRLEDQFPEAIKCLVSGFHAATQYFAFPRRHHRRIRSTNSLERLHGELKRRLNAVGAFPDRASALRLIVAVARKATEVWTDRRYLDMSLLNTPRNAA